MLIDAAIMFSLHGCVSFIYVFGFGGSGGSVVCFVNEQLEMSQYDAPQFSVVLVLQ